MDIDLIIYATKTCRYLKGVAFAHKSDIAKKGFVEDGEDYDSDIWAGVVPLKLQRLPMVPDPALKPGVSLPPYLKQ